MKFTELTKEQQKHFLKMIDKVGEPPKGTTHVDFSYDLDECVWLWMSPDGEYYYSDKLNDWEVATECTESSARYGLPEKPWYDPEDVKLLNTQTNSLIRTVIDTNELCSIQSTPERYQMFNSTLTEDSDLIDYWEATRTVGEFRQIILSEIDRYRTRYGKKDSCLTEAKKMRDYLNRLVAFEEKHHVGDEQEGVE